jgi:hypothetical protein
MEQTIVLPQQQGYPYSDMLAAAARATTPEDARAAAMSYHPMTMDYMVENGRANNAMRAIEAVIVLVRVLGTLGA